MTKYIHKDTAGLEYLNSVRDGSFKLGLGIDCDLDDHLRYKKTDFNVIAGHANVGKTLAILYYFLCLAIKHGLKFMIFSSENEIGGLKDDLISLYKAKKIADMDMADFEYSHYFVTEHFKFFDADLFFRDNKRLMNFRDILKECEEFSFDALVIDPYNSLGRVEDIKGNTHEYDYQVMSELRMWCKREMKALYLLAHGNTDALRKVFMKGHDFEGYPMPLVSADIEGGGKFVNRCDNFIVLHRMTQHPTEWMKTEWHVTKIKSTKTGGKPTFKKNPVIFEAQRNMLSFKCYIRQDDYTVVPHNWSDPLDKTSRIPEPEFGNIEPDDDFLSDQSKMF
jgi:hypothetical protein